MIKLTGSNVIKTTVGLNNNVLNGQVLDYISIMNPSGAMTITINNGDPLYIPAGSGFSSSDIESLTRINKVTIAENGVNYYWHGLQVGSGSKV